jgi:hypothetical protein
VRKRGGGVGGSSRGDEQLGAGPRARQCAALGDPGREATNGTWWCGVLGEEIAVVDAKDRGTEPDAVVVDEAHPGGHKADRVETYGGVCGDRIDELVDFQSGCLR